LSLPEQTVFPRLNFLFVMKFGMDLNAVGTERFEAVDGGTVIGVLFVGVLPAQNAGTICCRVHRVKYRLYFKFCYYIG
jgi:hypothetical protein